jgi:hypothetical protein
MTAAAAAARGAQAVVDRGLADLLALGVVVAGGLVEGVALGAAQGAVLPAWVPLRRGRFLAVTVLVAGLGWAAASAPGVMSGDTGGAAPSMWLVLAGAAGLGLVMGAALGAAQSSAMPPPSRRSWILANALAWPLAMGAIFAGATAPEAAWTLGQVLLAGSVTGAVAGTLLGLVTGRFLPRLAPGRESDVPLVRWVR